MPNSKKQYLLCLLFPLAFCSVSARAGDGKSEGGLHGYVTDAITKKPLSGVVVSAIIPGTNSPKEVTTDADGCA